MTNYEDEKIEEKYHQGDQKKKRQMKVSGKSVFNLKRIIVSKNQKIIKPKKQGKV
ncbi:MAG: hypothetical protein WC675_05560 [Patescibacteria group bacterium]|jgi:hypothetical protein